MKEKSFFFRITLLFIMFFSLLNSAYGQDADYPVDKRLSASIIIDGKAADWSNINQYILGRNIITGTFDDYSMYILIHSETETESYSIYIDYDSDNSTGFQSTNWDASGFEYKLTGSELFQYSPSAEWTLLCPVNKATDGPIREITIPLSCMNLLQPQDMVIAIESVSGEYLPSVGQDPLLINNYITGSSPLLVPPSNLRIMNNDSTLSIEWDGVAGADSYEIYLDGLMIDNSYVTNYTLPDLSYGTSFNFRVRSVFTGYNSYVSPWSTEIIAEVFDGDSPEIPQNLAEGSQGVTYAQVHIQWSPSSDNMEIAGYLVYRDGTLVSTQSGTTFTDTNVNQSTFYQYSVIAYDMAGNLSGSSSILNITTPEEEEYLTVTLNGSSDIIDSFLSSSNTDTNYGSTSYLGSFDHFSVQFNLPEDLTGKEIVEAKLAFYVWNQSNYQENQYLDLYAITKSWEEMEVTWNNADSTNPWTTEGGDFGSIVASIPHQEGRDNWDHVFYPEADVTGLVQNWVNGTNENFGFMLVNDSSTGIGLKASEYSSSSSPYLMIKYRELVDTEAPTAPADITAKVQSDTVIQLTWSQSSDNVGVDHYLLYRNGSLITSLADPVYNDTGLTADTDYTYTVCAVDQTGNISAYSNSGTARTWQSQVETTIILQAPTTEVLDSFLSSSSPDTNYGSTYYRTMEHFAISFIFPEELYNKTVVEAKLAFYVWNQTNYQPDQYLDLYTITRSWDESGVTWNNADTTDLWTTAGGDYGSIIASIPHMEGSENWNHTFYPEADVTSTVQNWLNGTVTNNGFMLVNDSETGIALKASEYSTGKRPYLSVTYRYYPNPDTTAPSIPAGLSGDSINNSRIDLSWNESTDDNQVSGYKIYRDGEEIAVTAEISYSDTGLSSSATYSYAIAAFDYSGNISAQSNSISVTTPNGTETYSLVTNSSNGQISLSPDQIEYETGSNVTVNAIPDSGYEFQSWGGDLSGSDNPSFIIMDMDKTITATFILTADTEAPTVPAGLELVSVTDTHVNIRWTGSTDNDQVSGYRIYRDNSFIAQINALSFSNTGLTALTTYDYQVSAIDPSGNESYRSFSLSVTTTDTPVTTAIIANHNTSDITVVPQSAIENAKANLVIAYGHTSHGSQITTGMTGMTGFMNGKGYPEDLYAWNSTGSDNALQLRDRPFSGASDLGNPDRTAWADATRTYLNSNPEVNIIMWSWCSQASSASESDIITYLSLMNELETDFTGVKFIYMTGHLDGTGETGNLNLRNEQIRDYCTANNKILYDFADIESYDPDGLINYMILNGDDYCDYDSDGNGSKESNWATAWQDSHVEDTDWYTCSSAHSQSLNANRKAYAIWYLFARLGGWTE